MVFPCGEPGGSLRVQSGCFFSIEILRSADSYFRVLTVYGDVCELKEFSVSKYRTLPAGIEKSDAIASQQLLEFPSIFAEVILRPLF